MLRNIFQRSIIKITHKLTGTLAHSPLKQQKSLYIVNDTFTNISNKLTGILVYNIKSTSSLKFIY